MCLWRTEQSVLVGRTGAPGKRPSHGLQKLPNRRAEQKTVSRKNSEKLCCRAASCRRKSVQDNGNARIELMSHLSKQKHRSAYSCCSSGVGHTILFHNTSCNFHNRRGRQQSNPAGRSVRHVGTQRSQGVAFAASSGKQRGQAEGRHGGTHQLQQLASGAFKKVVGLKIDGPAPFRKCEKQACVCGNALFHQHRRDLPPLGPDHRSDLPPAPKPTCQGRANEGHTRANLVHS